MQPTGTIPSIGARLLFTPGPLTTSLPVKEAMLRDMGSWDCEFNALIKKIREELLSIANLPPSGSWESLLLQGSGTYGVESVFATCVPPEGKVCVLANGAYGERMALMLRHLRIPHTILRTPENEPPDGVILDRTLLDDPGITHVAAVHCETTTGILNPIHELGRTVKRRGRHFILDAMSSFGALPIDFESAGIDFLISSPNKCLEGVPGFCFVICRRDALMENEGHARSLSLNLIDQLRGFEKNGQFRYTPPTHTLLAFEQALKELRAEGGITGRGARYRRNHTLLVAGMKRLGFDTYLRPEVQSIIITAFHHPVHPSFHFTSFYQRLNEKGFTIYPGKLSSADTFRIANIGQLFEADIRALAQAVGETLSDMGVSINPVPADQLHIL